MSSITINGMNFSGNNITITNGKVIIDGKSQTFESKEINISISGNIEKLEVDSCEKVSVIGNVETLKTISGDVEISGIVNGSVQTVSGDVKCGKISGDVKTVSGDIKNR